MTIDAVQHRILQEATRLFAAQGYDGTSIQQIAEAAGITRPTLVYHFTSKEGLRQAVLDRLFAHWTAELPRLLTAAQKGPRLDALLNNLFGFFQEQPALARLVLREALDRPEALRALLRQHLHPWTALLSEAIVLGQGGGWLSADTDPEAFITLMVASAVGLVAVGESAAALVPGEPGLPAQQAELTRVAKRALLNPRRPG